MGVICSDAYNLISVQVQRMEQRVEHGTMGTKQPGTVGMGGHRVVAEE